MPPGPAFNWLAVASSVADILSHAAQIKAAQAASRNAAVASRLGRGAGGESLRKRRKVDDWIWNQKKHRRWPWMARF